MTDDADVLAAGAVAVRDHDGEAHVLVVHRPKYDDWSLPKGKLDPGEAFETAAVRELAEETGVRGRLLGQLSPTRYRDRSDRSKLVRWWAVAVEAETPRPPDEEIDEVRWAPVAELAGLLTYPADLDLVAEARDGGRTSVLVVRHVHAGRRDAWDGDDRRRPVSARGRRQAELLARGLDAYHVARIVSSPYARCVQSVEPLAEARQVEVTIDDRLSEGTPLATVLEVVRESRSGTVLCSHGDVVGDLVSHFAAASADPPALTWPKASTWHLTFDDGAGVTAARYIGPPG